MTISLYDNLQISNKIGQCNHSKILFSSANDLSNENTLQSAKRNRIVHSSSPFSHAQSPFESRFSAACPAARHPRARRGLSYHRACRSLRLGHADVPAERIPGAGSEQDIEPAGASERSEWKFYGKVVRVSPKKVAFKDMTAIKEILITQDLPKNEALVRNFRLDPTYGDLLTATDRAWHKALRRVLSRAFSIVSLNELEEAMSECILELVDKLKQECNRGSAVVNIHEYLKRLSVDIIADAAFGETLHFVRDETHPLPEQLQKDLVLWALYALMPWLKYVPFVPGKMHPSVSKFTNDTIQKRKNGKRRNDLLQKLIDAQENPEDPLTDFDVFLQMGLFLQAGSDTSSNTLVFCVVELVRNPSVCAQLVSEIRDAFPSRDTLPSHTTLKELPYLNAVLNETLRMHMQSGQGIPRITQEDVVLGGFAVPKGTEIVASISQMARDPAIWPNPETFRPERFLEENVPMDAFMPFGAGSRNCIGKNFAYMSMRLTLGILLYHFDLELVPDQKVETQLFITYQIKGGKYLVKITPRQW
ncbi:cytochrome P450 [Endogone sp. FLAS-F59071]|nr:cytochrome P450 [Endogone sp. FLAS-F59071]|eukprot:RUS15510.1 cytochrome P450 [Endogone sp. FLAS-F59071]